MKFTGLTIIRSAPRTRGDCASIPRPCPRTDCKHNLGVARGTTTHYYTDHSCSLDVADGRPIGNGQDDYHVGLERIGEMLGVTRERARQIAEMAFHNLVIAAAADDDDSVMDSLGITFAHVEIALAAKRTARAASWDRLQRRLDRASERAAGNEAVAK